MKSNTLKIKNGTLELKAEGWNDVRKMLKKVQFICKLHDMEWVDVEHRGFTMMVEKDNDIEQLAQEFEGWEKGKKEDEK
ncbi:hypothetical protein [Geofilum rhodophaeum]|uniref:hypothetical protein n=1 Tax=Geofilum rhodophaeum TaxID=1965019 RepID=UPI000B5258F1|nr:hypothetical protein [Geofilum rhodophaeum]